MPTSKGKGKGTGQGCGEGDGVGKGGEGRERRESEGRGKSEGRGGKGREEEGRGVPPLLSLHFKHCLQREMSDVSRGVCDYRQQNYQVRSATEVHVGPSWASST